MVKRAGTRSSGGDRGIKQVESPRPVPPAGRPPAPSPPTEALALFQRGMEALQRHAYAEAATAFDAVILGFSQERGLLDRAKVYLGLCARESARRPPAPKTIEERLTAATAALNNDNDSAAEELARSVLGDDPKHDLALYLLAAVFARRGSTADALDFLGRAIALSPEASTQARTNDDFTSLHDEDAFWTLTEPPIVPAGTRRRRARG
jgi:tetratricopeptide (TPR) repeat protein